MSDRLKIPPERDFGFYQRRKHDKWREVPAPEPALEAAVADSHAHIHMLPDPAWELVRCAMNGVDFVCEICDPSEDGTRPFDELDSWVAAANQAIRADSGARLSQDCENLSQNYVCEQNHDQNEAIESFQGVDMGDLTSESSGSAAESAHKRNFVTEFTESRANQDKMAAPRVRIAVGVHPHNAKLYDEAIEEQLLGLLRDPRVAALGEIGLDYHYDLSPRDVQRRVFRRQIEIAQELELPLALHLRGGEDPQADDAHAEAFEILHEMGALGPRTLLHCCALPPDEIAPWVEADCYIAFGGALTFKSADAAREGARLVPVDRLMLETDSPYMTPEPMRGAVCTPAHVVFTAACLAKVRGVEAGPAREAFLKQLSANTLAFYGR